MSNNLESKHLLDEVDKFSGSALKERDDMLALILAASGDQMKSELENAAFTAKYINGLFRVLKAGAGNPDIKNIEQIKSDLSSNIQKFKEQLRNIISGNEPLLHDFENKYFGMNQSSFASLQNLLHDLEWVKKYLNREKRKS